MRSGNRLGGVMAWAAMVVVASVSVVRGAQPGIERVQPVPLGGTLTSQMGDRDYGVYVPTRFGGTLTVKTTDGRVEALVGPDGRTRRSGQEVGNDQQGWYTFKVAGAEKAYTVTTQFEQIGQASRFPWNFYYWPTKGDCVHEPWDSYNGRVDTRQALGDDIQVVPYGAPIQPGQDIILPGPNGVLETPPGPGDTSTWFPNMYDDLTWRGGDGTIYSTPSPLLKFDQLFNVSSRQHEAAYSQSQDIQRWPGHCLGGAVASVMLNEPQPAPGSGLTQDELKALWCELGENHLNHRIGDNVNSVPAGPPRPGPDVTDSYVSRFHGVLETQIRGNRKPLLANLRAFPPTGKPNEVWNHGVGKYVMKYHAVPGQNPRTVRIEMDLYANSGSSLSEDDAKPRHNTYEYIITYGVDGIVDESGTGYSDWIACGEEAMFAPLNVMEVAESRWQGHNPQVTEANVRAVDMANGGGGRFTTSAAPEFRPVAAYEAGRAPLFAGGGNRMFGGGGDTIRNANDGGLPPQPRRGLFRLFGGR